MGETTKIQWSDSTCNFWQGCTKVLDHNGKLTDSGCLHCYADARDKRFHAVSHWGKGAPRLKTAKAVKDALAFNRKPWVCDECGESRGGDIRDPIALFCAKCDANTPHHRRRIFSLSLGDWLDPEIPVEWLAEMLDTIRQCDQVTWVLCAKRPELWQERLKAVADYCDTEAAANPVLCDWLDQWLSGRPPQHVILLASVENQEAANKRIPELLRIPAACRGLSCEPLLGPVDLIDHCGGASESDGERNRINWLIIGGESGPKARPCNVEWIRSLVAQGQAAGVAVHVKQLGSNPTFTHIAASGVGLMTREQAETSKILQAITHPKGGDPTEWSADLRVREWPNGF